MELTNFHRFLRDINGKLTEEDREWCKHYLDTLFTEALKPAP